MFFRVCVDRFGLEQCKVTHTYVLNVCFPAAVNMNNTLPYPFTDILDLRFCRGICYYITTSNYEYFLHDLGPRLHLTSADFHTFGRLNNDNSSFHLHKEH